jgi:hypothetical protein
VADQNSAADVAASYIKAIELSNRAKILFWADNCCGLNKNWCLYTALCTCVNAEWGPEEITIKYLERGHTYLKADSIHAAIGKKMKKQSDIFTFPDFVDLCGAASKTIKPVVLEMDDFPLFTAEQRTRKTKTQEVLPMLSSICQVTFKKGARELFYKTDFTQEQETAIAFLKVKYNHSVFPGRRVDPRGIPSSKKDGIIKLLNCVPAAKKRFWLDLPTNDNAKDLVTHVERAVVLHV